MYNINEIAFMLYEQNRKAKLEDGYTQPNWMLLQDKKLISRFQETDVEDLPNYVRKTSTGDFEINITNAYYNQLGAEMQEYVKKSAEKLAQVIDAEIPKEKALETLHNDWLERNPNARESEFDVPFQQLPQSNQDQYIAQYETALSMKNAEKIKTPSDLDNVIKIFTAAKNEGKNLCCEFNGHILYSLLDDADSCYVKVCGITKEEFEVEAQKFYIKSKEKQQTLRNTAPEWKKRGLDFIYPAKTSDWFDCVDARVNDIYAGADAASALEVMEALDKGLSIEEATKIAEDQNHSGASWNMLLSIVRDFSKRGPEFFRANYSGELTPEILDLLEKIEEENKRFAELEKSANYESED